MKGFEQDHRSGSIPAHRQNPAGFTLVEVVVAVGIVAIAIPAILGIFSVFSGLTGSIVNLEDAGPSVNALQLYVDGALPDAATGEVMDFNTVYDWVYAARQDPADAQVLYAYRTDINKPEFLISQTMPTIVVGPIISAEIHPAGSTLLPDAQLVEEVVAYEKNYLPIRVDIFARSTLAGAGQRTAADFVTSFPVVLSR